MKQLVSSHAAGSIHLGETENETLCGKRKVRPVTNEECVKLYTCKRCLRELETRTGKREPRRYS